MKNWNSKPKFKAIGIAVLSYGLLAAGLSANDFVTMDELLDEDLDGSTVEVQDPFESVNRAIFKFNDFIYLKVMDPAASAYQAIAPDSVEGKLSNFFDNLNYPVRLAGNLMQGKVEGALLESSAFVINTTVGVVGLFRPSEKFPRIASLPKEDLGQALGAWGLGEGPYLVLPIQGPSSVRDFAGWFADRTIHPLQKPITQVDEDKVRTAYSLGKTVGNSPTLMQRYQQTKSSALDPYVALRNAYLQYREAAVRD